MKSTKAHRINYMKNILLPGLVLSGAAGTLTGILIFLFKFAANHVFKLSERLYAMARTAPGGLFFLLLGAAAAGLAAALILNYFPGLRGGGIPTAITVLRGIMPIKWVSNTFLLFISSLMSFLCGIPLGNEGPSVQMGTAVGRGTVLAFAKKHPAWNRYIMTGGACAGFAAATGAPLSGILFAFEEAHRRFSPMIFITSACSVLTGTMVSYELCRISGIDFYLFSIENFQSLPASCLWIPLVIGVVCGFAAAVFTKVYRAVGKLIKHRLKKIPFVAKTVCIFVVTALIGFFMPAALGTGHHIADELLEDHGVWYLLVLAFCVRALLLFFANNTGVTGGLFVPTLAFGAILGALCALPLVRLGIIPREYYPVMVTVGMTAFMSASARTPLMSISFAIEALCGLQNTVPIIMGAAMAYITVETLGVTAFTDTVIESKTETAHRGKTPTVVEASLVVGESSFAAGKEIRDILWPPTCTVLSVHRENADKREPWLLAGDLLTVHYSTYDPPRTLSELEAILGIQSPDVTDEHIQNEHDNVPDNS